VPGRSDSPSLGSRLSSRDIRTSRAPSDWLKRPGRGLRDGADWHWSPV